MSEKEEDFGNSIRRMGNVVTRPLQKWSTSVHRLLRHLEAQGFVGAPCVLGIEGEQEKLSYIAGETFNYPLTRDIASHSALVTAGKLLSKLHDATESFLANEETACLEWMLPSQEPQEVICHGDFAPYNVTVENAKVVGVFDFDAAHPAPRVWDLAYAVYCWAPFKTTRYDAMGSLTEQINRAKSFCDAYGADNPQRNALVETMIQRLSALIALMRSEAKRGNSKFAQDIEDGHLVGYQTDIEYLSTHKTEIRQGITIEG